MRRQHRQSAILYTLIYNRCQIQTKLLLYQINLKIFGETTLKKSFLVLHNFARNNFFEIRFFNIYCKFRT